MAITLAVYCGPVAGRAVHGSFKTFKVNVELENEINSGLYYIVFVLYKFGVLLRVMGDYNAKDGRYLQRIYRFLYSGTLTSFRQYFSVPSQVFVGLTFN
jgi:hypothetical protein